MTSLRRKQKSGEQMSRMVILTNISFITPRKSKYTKWGNKIIFNLIANNYTLITYIYTFFTTIFSLQLSVYDPRRK